MLTYNIFQNKELYEENDPMFDEAVRLVVETGKVSASLIQRRLRLGYARSARLLDMMEQAGVVGPANGVRPREVLIFSMADVKKRKLVEREEEKEEVSPIIWKKTKWVKSKPDGLEVELGEDERGNMVKLDLEQYGNLFVFGSQFTGSVDLLNNVLVRSVASYSPEKLRVIAVDAIGNDLVVANDIPHLLTPVITEPEKVVSALKWTVAEIEKRIRYVGDMNCPNILLLISSLNEAWTFAPAEIEDNLYRVLALGRKVGVFCVIGTDYLSPNLYKGIIANMPARIVFKPTDEKIARQFGILEALGLSSADEAILETMYEGKKRIKVNKLAWKEIYGEVFEERV